MTKDELVKSRIEDIILQCRDGYYVTATGLLDTHEQAIASAAARGTASTGVRTLMYGGYDGAERRMLVCIPADIPMTDEDAVDGLLEVLRVRRRSGKISEKVLAGAPKARELTHRDYLGSMLGLGIDRSVTGDILVRPDGADIIIMPEIADFLMSEYSQVGRVEVTTEVVSVGELIVPEARSHMIRDTVPSVRLDSVISSSFKLSRSKAAEAIRGGIVSVDHIECIKPDARVDEGSTLVLRGKGKAILRTVGNESKKGRIWIEIERLE